MVAGRTRRGWEWRGRAVATPGVRWSRLKRFDAARAQQLPTILPPLLLTPPSLFFSHSPYSSLSSSFSLPPFSLLSPPSHPPPSISNFSDLNCISHLFSSLFIISIADPPFLLFFDYWFLLRSSSFFFIAVVAATIVDQSPRHTRPTQLSCSGP